MATIQVRVDDSIKEQADLLFGSLGLDMSTAVSMFLFKSLENNGIPFIVEFKQKPKSTMINTRSSMFGCLQGQYKISNDFDDPIDDFKEYM